jgi:hypothetical protein
MSDLYSYKGSYPYPLPTDMSKYDMSDFVLAPTKPIIPNGEVLEWIGNNWMVRDATDNEITVQWNLVRNARDAMLLGSDVLVVREYENGNPISDAMKIYRQALRDITLQINPFSIEWPIAPE